MQLIRFEFFKMMKKKVVVIAMAAFALIYVTMLWSWIFGSEWAVTQDGRELYGKEAEAYNTEISERYAGSLTDEKVRKILAEFPRLNGGTIYDVSNNTYYPIANLFAEKDGTWNGKTVKEVFPEFEEPPVLGMSSRWESFLYSMMYIVMMAGILVIIVVSPVFSEEYSSGMDALILTTDCGKRQCALAKTAAAFCFSIGFGAAVLLVGFLMFYIGRGGAGWNADIQLGEMTIFAKVPQPLKCYEAAILTVLVAMASIITVTGVTLLLSVVSRTSFISIILSAAAYLTPMFITPGDENARRIIMLFPVNSLNVSGVLRAGNFNAGAVEISIILIICAIAAVMLVLGTGYSQRVFSRHQCC